MKKIVALLLAVLLIVPVALIGCNKKGEEELSAVEKIIAEAQGMTLEELAKNRQCRYAADLRVPLRISRG